MFVMCLLCDRLLLPVIPALVAPLEIARCPLQQGLDLFLQLGGGQLVGQLLAPASPQGHHTAPFPEDAQHAVFVALVGEGFVSHSVFSG